MKALRYLLLSLGAALVVAAGVIGWMSRHSFRKEPVPVEVGLHGEALEDQTLLLEKWLRAEGRPVTRDGGLLLPASLPADGTLILLHLSHPLTDGEVGLLLGWVRRGGHLITDGSAAPFNDGRSLARLHSALGVTLKDLHSDQLFSPDEHKDGEIRLRDDPTPFRVRRNVRWRLVPDREEDWSYRLGGKLGSILLERREGRGSLRLTSDLSFVYRDGLGDLDHAAYTEHLLDGIPRSSTVVVWSKPVDIALFPWLWAHAWPAILALGFLLAAWLWRGFPRFGPLMPEPLPERRSLLEHLAASARLVWQGGSGPHLVARAREALEKRAQRLNPAYAGLAMIDRALWLAETTGGRVDDIAEALDDRPTSGRERDARILLILQQLRQRL